jgi:ethanolamine-phosphate cytidylyltransferase
MTLNGNERKSVRIWVDGCFDMMHFGHANALRQAKTMGDYLIVGIHSDEEIQKHKGPTVMNQEERYKAVAACKWVDEVVPNVPYYTTVAMLDRYQCDFCVHGDDLTTTAEGVDCYQEVKAYGRYRECKRTIGISTTELVGRMLLMTKDHQIKMDPHSGPISQLKTEDLSRFTKPSEGTPVRVSQFLPTSKRIVQFSEGREPAVGDRVVYVDGDFDLFHVGHIEFLRLARELGDYLLVGVHDDSTVNRIKGGNFPIMNLHERILGVLSCRYVDEVIIGAPYSVTQDVLNKVYKVSIVAHGSNNVVLDIDNQDPYRLPKELSIFRIIDTPFSKLTSNEIIRRIIARREEYELRK